jgi:curved DNA-binding protein CbpA
MNLTMNMNPRLFEQNLYEILEVEATASQQDIHKAYQRVRATYNQDSPALYSMFTKEEAQELLKLIEEAYSVLGNPTLRDVYDQRLRGGISSTVTYNQTLSPQKSTVEVANQFAIPEAGVMDVPEPQRNTFSQEFKMTSKQSDTSNQTAEGMGQTKFSVYKLDPVFENEIKGLTTFDGPTLKKIRTYKNITLEKMADITKVSGRYLNAVEANDEKNLPAPVFVRGFVIQIARILALNEKAVSNSYMEMFKKAKT